jgi:hypothetical protein
MARTLEELDTAVAALEIRTTRIERILEAILRRVRPDVTVEPGQAASRSAVEDMHAKIRASWDDRTGGR